jgi:hypothetical protein
MGDLEQKKTLKKELFQQNKKRSFASDSKVLFKGQLPNRSKAASMTW